MLVPAAFAGTRRVRVRAARQRGHAVPMLEDIELEGDNLDGDLRKNITELKNVVITGCDARIEAELARVSKLDFEDSRWTFEGNVRIRMEAQQGSLVRTRRSSNFRNNQIQRVTITGKPAEFEQRRTDSGATARGRAGEIVYELDAGTVQLSDDAWLSDGEHGNPRPHARLRHPQAAGAGRPYAAGAAASACASPSILHRRMARRTARHPMPRLPARKRRASGNPAGGPDKPEAP